MAKVQSSLVLGWKVDENKAPKYWLQKGASPGAQTDADLVCAPSASMAHHTAVVAQSGSGKSFFLGRVIEEIVLRTKARCLIFDPNADFTRISDVVSESLWTSAEYSASRGGKLPHEATREEFDRDWRKVAVRVWTGGKVPPNTARKRLSIPVSLLSAEFLAEELDPRYRSDLYLCQEVMRQMEGLYRAQASPGSAINLVEKLQILLEYAKNARHGRTSFDREFPPHDDGSLARGSEKGTPRPVLATSYLGDVWSSLLVGSYASVPWTAPVKITANIRDFLAGIRRRQREDLFDALQRLANDVPPDVPQFYVSRLEALHYAGILDRGLVHKDSTLPDVDVVDLPSLGGRDTQLLAVDYLLTSCWDQARREWASAIAAAADEDTRAPVFVVIDEAHNLIAREPRSLAERVVRERFRTIAAEGRKLGIFLVIVSQNPAKLDKFVLSECENRALMRLNSPAVLKLATEDLGLEHLPPGTLQACLNLGLGRALIDGPWSPQGSTFLFSAARRTVEGGRNLRTEHWATAPNRPDKPTDSVGKGGSEPPIAGAPQKAGPETPPGETGPKKRPPSAKKPRR
jgi:hypothetical protein